MTDRRDEQLTRACARARASGRKTALAAGWDGGVVVDLQPGDMTNYRLVVVPPTAHHYDLTDGALVDRGRDYRRTWIITRVLDEPITVEWSLVGGPVRHDESIAVKLSNGNEWSAAVIAEFLNGLAEAS